jgi:hypothetical protein
MTEAEHALLIEFLTGGLLVGFLGHALDGVLRFIRERG